MQRDQYSIQFNSKQFLQTFRSTIDSEWNTRFRLKQRHNFFQKYSAKWDSSSAKLLEFGGGPTLLDLISAAPHVAEIVHTTYTPGEREEIEKWMNRSEGAHDWTQALKHVVCELESNKRDDAWREREELIRSRLKITFGDITQEHPVSSNGEKELFSVVSTTFCLESACKTYTEYKRAVKKMARLLKLGGYLVMLVVEEQTFYTVGEQKWPILTLSLAQVKEALDEAGFSLLVAERAQAPLQFVQSPTHSNEKAVLFIAAYKTKST